LPGIRILYEVNEDAATVYVIKVCRPRCDKRLDDLGVYGERTVRCTRTRR
jgi:hypothetical protein